MELENNWREEQRSAYLYQIMATYEGNVLYKKLFSDLHTAALEQAALWEKKIRAQNLPQPIFKPDLRIMLVGFLIRVLGPKRIQSMLAAMKIRGLSVFTQYHSEHQHISVTASNNLRAAVFGVNDGLISNSSLILGMAGASSNHHTIILAGVAGLIAGAASMGVGEYISVRSQREVFEYQIAIEKQELEEYPEEEKKELSLIYQARGVSKKDADHLSQLMIDNPATGLNTLAREELGLNPDDLVSPFGAMFFSFFSFALGAFIPLVPFLLNFSDHSITLSIGFTASSLFVIGMIISLFSNKNPIVSGCRMLFMGMAAGVITYYIGKWIT